MERCTENPSQSVQSVVLSHKCTLLEGFSECEKAIDTKIRTKKYVLTFIKGKKTYNRGSSYGLLDHLCKKYR